MITIRTPKCRYMIPQKNILTQIFLYLRSNNKCFDTFAVWKGKSENNIVEYSIILFSLAQFLFFSFYDLLNFARMGLCVTWQNEEYFLIIFVLYLWNFRSHFGSHFLDCWNCWCCWFCLGCCCLSSWFLIRKRKSFWRGETWISHKNISWIITYRTSAYS